MKMERGLLRKGIGGFYYVEAADTIYEAKARGIFRKRGITPLAGDMVDISIEDDGTCTIEEIGERKNALVRPPVANLDQLFLVVSVLHPSPNLLVLDKMLAGAEQKGISPVIVFSKTDLEDCSEYLEIYRNTGIPVVTVSSVTGDGVEQVRKMLKGKLSAFSGNSGVGKSSLLNRIDDQLSLPTAEISQKLGRGRHTTRQVELLKLGPDTYVADTPGFSSVDMVQTDLIRKENLAHDFREFAPYLDQCRFPSCSHTKEKGCAILAALQEGKISPSRHQSYVAMYDEIKNIKEWELK
ncbi:MAG: ribosome small subunit-dependent GTPase A [Clostridium sp.]|uniref:ribosome small subunit-dependent GTPase A n=1 Tax=Clostridium sp. TaxID=1506 RepID=UPI00290E1C2F|nr:ribosome small subunit-dependent GTPase A [Clostridium sp.]MDU7337162.1 ribosome small subunit-dependent GTPase A [Clostridium sp.]